LVALVPLFIELVANQLLGDDKCPEPFNGQVFTGFINCSPIGCANFVLHHNFGAFEIKNNSTRVAVTQNDAHAFGVGREREVGKHLVVLKLAVRVRYLNAVLISFL